MKTPKYLAPILVLLAPSLGYSVDRCQAVFDGTAGRRQESGQNGRAERSETKEGRALEEARANEGELIPAQSSGVKDIYIKEKVGPIEEHMVRVGSTAVHLYAESSKGGESAYAFMAMPAGNSGVALWFKPNSEAVNLSALSPMQAVNRGKRLHGGRVELSTGVKLLDLDDSVLGSMRYIRDRELKMAIPADLHDQKFTLRNQKLVIKRRSVNQLVDYVIEIEPLGDTRIVSHNGSYRLSSETEVKFRMVGLSGEKPLTPLSILTSFKEEFLPFVDGKKLEAFDFLYYAEKLLAGSPRYDSEFGRDILYTVTALFDFFKPEAIEGFLRMKLDSMRVLKTGEITGEISHERHEGDFASYERKKAGEKYVGVTEDINDYEMKDDDFAFAILAMKFMKRYPERAEAFLAQKDSRGHTFKDLIDANIAFVEKTTAAFVENPVPANMIHFHEGRTTGDWRDSDTGTALKDTSFSVNNVFVPGALKRLADVFANENLPMFHDAARAEKFRRAFEVWNTKSLPYFMVRVPKEELRAHGEATYRRLGFDVNDLPATPNQDIVFPAIAIDKKGEQARVMHTDDSLMMLFGYPSEAYIKNMHQRIRLPVPYGTFTPMGFSVAVPTFAPKEVQEMYTPDDYHGFMVSWTMQEDLTAIGINRQLKNPMWSAATKREMVRSQKVVEQTLKAKSDLGGVEVVTMWKTPGTQQDYTVKPFAGNAKANLNQLWSHLQIINLLHSPAGDQMFQGD